MSNQEGRAIADAYIAEAERLEAVTGLYLFHAKWCRAQAEVLLGHKAQQEQPAGLPARAKRSGGQA